VSGAAAASSEALIPFLFTLDVHDKPDLADKINGSLDVLGRQGIPCTYYVVAEQVAKHKLGPVLRRIVAEGHEVANHSLLHREPENVKEDPVEEQVRYLGEAKDILEQESGAAVISFRAPGFKISHRTMIALEETGHRTDVSVNSQRFPLFGSDITNLGWYYAPRRPYHPSRTNCFRRGDLSLWEIPFSSFVLPFMSRLYSYFNMATARAFTRLLEWESKHVNGKPMVYMTHPEEFHAGAGQLERIPINWKLLIPSPTRGFTLRILFQELDEATLYQRTMEMNDFLLSRDGLEFLTVSQYGERLDA
jgi:hypothetical protein